MSEFGCKNYETNIPCLITMIVKRPQSFGE